MTEKSSDIDAGYAWVITLSVFMWEVIMAVIFKTFGVLHVQLEELFGHGAFKTSLVAFVMSMCWIVFAPLGGFMAYKLSYRVCIIIGAILCTGK